MTVKVKIDAKTVIKIKTFNYIGHIYKIPMYAPDIYAAG